jgi:hypothetical protein
MTSFEQPEASLLVEHLLPSLLGLYHAPTLDYGERNGFFGELCTTLERLHTRLTVISSPPQDPRRDPQYPWIWRYVSHFRVGRERYAIQHAKLWAFHWRIGEEEHLELHVSSTNLTLSAFRMQLQAGWQVILPLEKRPSRELRRTWADIIPFLEALGAAAGEIATQRIQGLVALLSRARCPEGITFVASVPGQKGASRQLAKLQASHLHILVPTVGNWNGQTLSDWFADTGISAKRTCLKWIAAAHPWAATSGWAMTHAAKESIGRAGTKLHCLPDNVQLANQHRDGDPRWSHAKLYLLAAGQKRWLLVTSANWSTSAWGAGKLAPRNFELGVLFRSSWSGLERHRTLFSPPETTPFCVDRSEAEFDLSTLEWAEVKWDGEVISFLARSSDTVSPIGAVVTFSNGSEAAIILVDGEAAMPWNDPRLPPCVAKCAQGTSVLMIDVVDLRASTKFAESPLPEVDPEKDEALREAFLLQRYNGPAVDIDSIFGISKDREPAHGTASGADYSVLAWLQSRAAFKVVDAWRAALDAASDDATREWIYADGYGLLSIFQRRMAHGDRLAAEEIAWRLEK